MIPVVDLVASARSSRGAPTSSAVRRVMRSGSLLLGPELDAFEREAATLLGGMDVVGVSSGAGAIQLALAALGIGPGDEVIVPAFTAVPTASRRSAPWGPRPWRSTSTIDTALIDIDRALDAVTDRTRAIVPVHLYGRPADLSELTGAGLPIVEDAAQAHGAVTAPVGSAVTYSFYPTKNVGGIGDGGAVATSDPELAAALRRRRAHGMTEQYVHVDVSQNFRMSELEAAWLRLQLPTLAADNARRAAIARHYRSAAPAPALAEPTTRITCSTCASPASPIVTQRGRSSPSAGVGTAVHYPLAITQQPAYRDLAGPPCPVAESLGGGVRERAVLPRTHRRRGRDRGRRTRPGAGMTAMTRREWYRHERIGTQPERDRGVGVLPLLQRRTVDPDDGPRRSGGAATTASTTSRSSSSTTDRPTVRSRCSRRSRTEVPELRIVRHETNRGYGGALISGFAAATRRSGSSTPTATPSTTPPNSCGASTRSRPTPTSSRAGRSGAATRGTARSSVAPTTTWCGSCSGCPSATPTATSG